MRRAIVTGSAGLVGSEMTKRLSREGFLVVGIDNDMRRHFFGESASTNAMKETLLRTIKTYRHEGIDIRDAGAVDRVFSENSGNLELIVHAASQPSHDWAAREPVTDFTTNANGTLTLLEATRKHAADATFVFLSTNKVYGDTPNRLPLVELDTRMEVDGQHPYRDGIDETMSIDCSTHSLFGVSKAAADLLVQEYGRYFGMKTVCLRGGCLTGPAHAGARLHGFLSYLMKCVVSDLPYTVYGYKGKQVRDNLHSSDLASAIMAIHANPSVGEAFNIGGGRSNSCSVLEAISMAETIAGRELRWSYEEANRVGDHIWWITDNSKFMASHVGWEQEYTLERTMRDIHSNLIGEKPAQQHA